MRRLLLPLLLVPVVSAVLVAFRPQLATAPLMSWRAFLATALVAVGGVLALALVWRRSRLGAVWVADVVVLALMAAVVWPVFRERTVVEDFPPVVLSAPTPTVAATPSASGRPVVARPSPSATPSAVPTRAAAPSPSAAATRLLAGSLRGIDHHAEGGVALYRVGDGVRLRFEDVDIEGTPTPSVHLVPEGRESPKGGTRLGGLKGEKGSFSYAVPAGLDLSRGWSVLVWCDRYAVPIAAADLG
jgi:hypothetical protein